MAINRLLYGALAGLLALVMLGGCAKKSEPYPSSEHIGRYEYVPQQSWYPKASPKVEEPEKPEGPEKRWPGPIKLTPEEQLELQLESSRYMMRFYGK